MSSPISQTAADLLGRASRLAFARAGVAPPVKDVPRPALRAFVGDGWHVLEPSTVFKANWHIDCVCEHLEAVSRGDIQQLLVNLPPRHMKSVLISVMWPAWVWGPLQQPAERWLYASYAQNLAIRDAVKMRRLIRHPWYVDQWGSVFSLVDDQNQKIRYENDRTGYRIASSVDGANTGEGGSYLVADDPNSVRESESDTVREATNTWWDEVMSSRTNDPERVKRVIVQQRTHATDLSGHVLAKGGYHHLNLPARFERPKVVVDSVLDGRGGVVQPGHDLTAVVGESVVAVGVGPGGQRPEAVGAGQRTQPIGDGALVEVAVPGVVAGAGQPLRRPGVPVVEDDLLLPREEPQDRLHAGDGRLADVEPRDVEHHAQLVGDGAAELAFGGGGVEPAGVDADGEVEDAQSILQRELYRAHGPQPHLSCSIGHPDPRAVDGELLWPNRFGSRALRRLEVDMGPVAAAGQLQQRPVPRSGAIFRAEWLHDLPPGFDTPDPTTGRSPRASLAVVQFWDTAWSEKTSANYTAGVTVGIDRPGNLYVLHSYRERIGEEHLADKIAETVLATQPHKVGVELAAFKTATCRDMIRRLHAVLRGKRAVDVEGVEVTTDKVFRAQVPAGRAKLGMLYADKRAPWYPAFEQELLGFPRGEHDDQVDALSGAATMAIERVKLDPNSTSSYGYDGKAETTTWSPFDEAPPPNVIRRNYRGEVTS